MDDEGLTRLENACADLVALKQWEPVTARLLIGRRTAEWVRVGELCREAGLDAGDLGPDLLATWLPDSTGDAEYAVVVFFDEESMWTTAARYNRGRLLERMLASMGRAAGQVSEAV